MLLLIIMIWITSTTLLNEFNTKNLKLNTISQHYAFFLLGVDFHPLGRFGLRDHKCKKMGKNGQKGSQKAQN